MENTTRWGKIMKFKVKSKQFIAGLLACTIIVPTTGSAFAETPNTEVINSSLNVVEVENELVDSNLVMSDNQLQEPQQAVAAGAVYFIPGLGQVALLATGAVVFAGVTYWAGSWVYTKVQQFLSSSVGVPSSLKQSDGSVNLGKFTEKVKGKTAYKDPKTGWTIEKDTAGHGGRKWKLKDKKGNRKASLDGKGKILSK